MDRARDMKEWMDSVHEAISDLQTWRVNTDDSTKALTERVKELEDAPRLIYQDILEKGLGAGKIKMPPTGPIRFGPVLYDGKAEPDLSQRPPFVTGLSVLDSLKK